MTIQKNYDIVIPETKNNTFTERNSIMKTFTSVIRYMSQREAIFQYQEYSYAKHAHFQDKQKYWTNVNC
jgi:hypothetical protein